MIWMYIRLSFRALFKEPVMLVPYAAYYAVLNIIITLYFSNLNLEKLFQLYKFKLGIAALGMMLGEAFILGVTLSAIRAVVDAEIDKKTFLKRSFFVGSHTLLGTLALVPLVVAGVMLLKPLFALSTPFRLLGLGVGFLSGCLILLFKLLFPAAIAVDHIGWVKAYRQTFLLLKRQFVLSVAVALGLFSFWMLMLIVAELFGQVPVIGLSVFNVGIQSVAAIVAAGVPFFYYAFITLSPLKITWQRHESDDDGKSSL